MAVFRVNKTQDYTVMSNFHLRDKSLSLKSKGLLSLILSLPEDLNYMTRGLAAICKEGVDSLGTAIKKLETARYIKRNQLRDDKGKITDTKYVIYEKPQENLKTVQPHMETPHTKNPYVDMPSTKNGPHIKFNKSIKVDKQMVKDWLKQGRKLKFEIDALKEARQKALNSAVGGVASYSRERVQTSNNTSERNFAYYSDYCVELDQRIKELEKHR